ncbi:MAG: PilC/PilY family type IV pilus protein, partial [Candidatus Aminicenantales bacterium]
IGDRNVLNLPALSQVGDKVNGLGVGFKVWADPVTADYTLYFSTLPGSIEAVNPCANLAGAGQLYGRIIRPGSAGNPVGGTALKSAQIVPPEYLEMSSKARQAVTVGDVGRSGNVNKREVFIQEYNSTIEMLEQPIGSLLQIKSWREIYQIIR